MNYYDNLPKIMLTVITFASRPPAYSHHFCKRASLNQELSSLRGSSIDPMFKCSGDGSKQLNWRFELACEWQPQMHRILKLSPRLMRKLEIKSMEFVRVTHGDLRCPHILGIPDPLVPTRCDLGVFKVQVQVRGLRIELEALEQAPGLDPGSERFLVGRVHSQTISN